MWLTRNKNGFLTLWRIKPKREGDVWVESQHILCGYMAIEDDDIPLCSNVKWEDEPIEVELSNTNRRFIQCDKCGKAFSYLPRDVHSFTVCLQPSSGYEDEYEYVNCPHCKSEVYI